MTAPTPAPRPTPADQELSLEQLLHHTAEDLATSLNANDLRRVTITGSMAQCMQTLALGYRTCIEECYPLCLRPGMTIEERGRLLSTYQDIRKTAVLAYDALDSALRLCEPTR